MLGCPEKILEEIGEKNIKRAHRFLTTNIPNLQFVIPTQKLNLGVFLYRNMFKERLWHGFDSSKEKLQNNGKRNERSHYKNKLMVRLQKKNLLTPEHEALKMARFLNTKENVIHKMVAYKCANVQMA